MDTQASKAMKRTGAAAAPLALCKGALALCLALCTSGFGLSANAQNREATIISFDAPGEVNGTFVFGLNRSGATIATSEPLPHQPSDYMRLAIAPQGPRPAPYRARFGEIFSRCFRRRHEAQF